MIKGTVNGQKLTVTYDTTAADTIKFLTAHFDLSEEWTGYNAYVHFAKNGSELANSPFDVTDGEITANDGLNLTSGNWEVWLHGNKTDSAGTVHRVTTNIEQIRIVRTGVADGEPFPTLTPSVVETQVAQAQAAASSASESAASASTAKNYAQDYKLAAEESKRAAATSATNAGNSATSASNSATTATNAATSAQASAQSAAASAASISAVTWDTLSGKPNTFTPSAHTHSTDDVTGLETALADKANASDVTDLYTALDGKADTDHTHSEFGEIAKLPFKDDNTFVAVMNQADSSKNSTLAEVEYAYSKHKTMICKYISTDGITTMLSSFRDSVAGRFYWYGQYSEDCSRYAFIDRETGAWNSGQTNYATANYYDAFCSTSATAANKKASAAVYPTASVQNNGYRIRCIWANPNEAGVASFELGSLGSKPLYLNGSAVSSSNYNIPRGTWDMYCDGTKWYITTNGTDPKPTLTASEQQAACARLGAEPKHGQFELLNDYTFTASGTSFSKTADDNGNPYNLKSVMVVVSVKGGSDASDATGVFIRASTTNDAAGWVMYFNIGTISHHTSESIKKYVMAKAIQEDGILTSSCIKAAVSGLAEQGGSNPVIGNIPTLTTDTIKYILVNGTLPVGCNVKVYGIKA